MAAYENHINQSERNFQFLKKNIEEFPNHFFGWKIIACFYCSLHLMKALLISRYKIETSIHSDIEKGIKDKVKRHVWVSYRNLRVESEKCRYNGFIDSVLWDKLNKSELKRCLERLKEVNNEVIKKGVVSPVNNTDIDDLIRSL